MKHYSSYFCFQAYLEQDAKEMKTKMDLENKGIKIFQFKLNCDTLYFCTKITVKNHFKILVLVSNNSTTGKTRKRGSWTKSKID